MALRTQRQILWVGNRREGKIARGARHRDVREAADRLGMRHARVARDGRGRELFVPADSVGLVVAGPQTPVRARHETCDHPCGVRRGSASGPVGPAASAARLNRSL